MEKLKKYTYSCSMQLQPMTCVNSFLSLLKTVLIPSFLQDCYIPSMHAGPLHMACSLGFSVDGGSRTVVVLLVLGAVLEDLSSSVR